MSAPNEGVRRLDRSVEMANRIRHKRQEVVNAGRYFIGERSPVTGKITCYSDPERAMFFWEAFAKKQGLNCGRKHPRFFVIDGKGTVISTIDHKLKTIPRERR